MNDPQRRTTQLQRVPPHDGTLEGHLLGAAMLSANAARVVALTPPDHFYTPRHGHIAAAITQLVNQGDPTDAGTVGSLLNQQQLLDSIGGYPTLTDLTLDVPATESAAVWADTISRYATQRHTLSLAAEVVEAVYRGVPTSGLIAEMHRAATETELLTVSTWQPANLAAVLAGDGPDITPTALARTDGINLLYAGRIHVINAEPEAGKSWICLHACAQQIAAGNHTVYIDFESDAPEIVTRLLTLGIAPVDLLERFHYIHPQDPLDASSTAHLQAVTDAYRPTLCVIDGVTEVMAAAGYGTGENDDIARFYSQLPKPLAASGAAVVMIDHVVKDKENQGRWAIGGQHKLAGIDGAAYKLEAVTPFARNKPGTSRLIVNKDRPGMVRPHTTGHTVQVVATVTFDSDGDTMNVNVEPPGPRNNGQPFVPTRFMEQVSEALRVAPQGRLSKRAIRSSIRGKNEYIDLAIDHLVSQFYARETKAGIEYLMSYKADDTDGDRYIDDPPDEFDT